GRWVEGGECENPDREGPRTRRTQNTKNQENPKNPENRIRPDSPYFNRLISILRYHTWSPWSWTRMWPFCSLPKRSMPLNLLFSIAARVAGESRSYSSTVLPLRMCVTWFPLTITSLVFHSPAGLIGRSCAGKTSYNAPL